ncbi:T9SS type A sorting domain-containing protein [candidate division KSB1 bacterium]|nr:T9SS type A sorting domain-containing protein [candidate division KSB1 bacterium]
MNRMITILIVALLALSTAGFGQWEFVKNFPDDEFLMSGGGNHGLAVDPEGKIWVQQYGATDSIQLADGTWEPTRVLYVFNPDGSQADFSPIKTVTVGAETDTLFNSGRGLRTGPGGHILASFFDELFVIDYMTGQGLAKAVPIDGETLDAAAYASEANTVFTGHVVPPKPIMEWDADFTFLSNAIDAAPGFSRAFEVSPDGNTIFWAGFTLNYVILYNRADEFSPFDSTGIWPGFACESFGWQPETGYLYLSSGSYLNPPNGHPDITTNYQHNVWYGRDPENDWAIVDSIEWVFNTAENADERPRAIAFSVTGDTAYVGCFGTSDYPAVQMHVKTGTAVERNTDALPQGFELEQNYPNPFNPSTTIAFNLQKDTQVELRVYDVMGREITTLVSQRMIAGRHSVEFNGADLASGVYYYTLSTDNQTQTKKMLLIK